MAEATQGHPLQVVSQNMNAAASGAFTGEISAEMLKSISIQATLLGHSERRAYYNETDESLTKKVKTAQENGMEIIFCFGEELADRKSNKHFEVVAEQLETGLFSTEALDWSNIILAYEPVWAIGTGETTSHNKHNKCMLSFGVKSKSVLVMLLLKPPAYSTVVV